MNALLKKMKRWIAGVVIASMTLVSNAQTITYFHNDVGGSPLLATDATGNIVWKETYKPYGEKVNNQAASSDNKIGYAGKPFDDNTGLTYMGARYYDPVVGRFMGVDPKGFTAANIHSFNRYTYANNNPHKFVDPDGKAALLIPALFVVSVLGMGTTIYANDPNARESLDRLGRAARGLIGSVVRSESAEAPPPENGIEGGSEEGCIYCVKGDKTSSGKDYIGSTDDMDQRKRDKTDGRDRNGAEIVDTYPKGDRDARRSKEQQAINDRGGVDKLDNKRNEVSPKKWDGKGISPPTGN